MPGLKEGRNINDSKKGQIDNLQFEIFPDRNQMGYTAAQDTGRRIKELLLEQDEVRMVFAAAPSQNELLSELIKIRGIDWKRITAFHMDEYIGLDCYAPQRFGFFLYKRIFDLVPFKRVHYLYAGKTADPILECKRYAGLLNEAPIDIVCMGIGENGHIAFNDPPVANFDDPETVKIVELDQVCRQQQVNDGCFSTLEDVPTQAITLTVPAICSGKNLFVVVPGLTKADAVKSTLEGPIETTCPASILRKHSNAKLYLDNDSASKLNKAIL